MGCGSWMVPTSHMSENARTLAQTEHHTQLTEETTKTKRQTFSRVTLPRTRDHPVNNGITM